MNAIEQQDADRKMFDIVMLMIVHMCRECKQYTTGCTPDEVINCTEYFINSLKNGEESC